MPKREREKGRRRENEIVKRLNEIGISAKRISQPYVSSDDLSLTIDGLEPLTGEVKARANGEGFKTVVKWKREADILFLVADRKDPFVFMDFALLAKLINR